MSFSCLPFGVRKFPGLFALLFTGKPEGLTLLEGIDVMIAVALSFDVCNGIPITSFNPISAELFDM